MLTGMTGLCGMSAIFLDSATPDDVKDLALWLMADRGVYADGAAAFTETPAAYLSCVSASGLQGNTSFTASCWFILDGDATTYRPLLTKMSGPVDTAGLTGEYAIYADPSEHIYLKLSNGVGGATSVNGGAAPVQGWTLVNAWYDTSVNKCFIQLDNATPVEAAAVTGPAASAENFRLGSGGGSQNFAGRADSAFFWKRVLTADERSALFNGGAGVRYQDLTAGMRVGLTSAWNLNEASGVRYDSHGANNLTNTNSVVGVGGIQQGVVASGEPLSLWFDFSKLSAGYALQDTISKRCAWKPEGWNAKPTCLFDGFDDETGGALSLGSSGVTVFAVASVNSGSGYKAIFANDLNVFLGTNNGKFASFYGNGTAWGTTSDWGVTLQPQTPYVLTSKNNGTDFGYVNGSGVGSRANTMAAFTDGYAIGNIPGGNNFWNHHISEVIVYNRAVTDAERAFVEKYLSTKYGITLWS